MQESPGNDVQKYETKMISSITQQAVLDSNDNDIVGMKNQGISNSMKRNGEGSDQLDRPLSLYHRYHSLDPFRDPQFQTLQFQFEDLYFQFNSSVEYHASNLHSLNPDKHCNIKQSSNLSTIRIKNPLLISSLSKAFSKKLSFFKTRQEQTLNYSIDYLNSMLSNGLEDFETHRNEETELKSIDDFSVSIDKLLILSIKYDLNARNLYSMLGKRIPIGSETWNRVFKSLIAHINNLAFAVENFLKMLKQLDITKNLSLEYITLATDKLAGLIERIVNIPVIEKADNLTRIMKTHSHSEQTTFELSSPSFQESETLRSSHNSLRIRSRKILLRFFRTLY